MHIPDGFMDGGVAAAGAVLSVGAVSYALHKTKGQLEEAAAPLPGLVAAFVFAMQMVNFPIAGGTSGHVLGATLATVLVGPYLAITCMSVVFVVQALVFADGGITALGLNVLNGAVISVIVATLILRLLKPLTGHSATRFLVRVGVAAWLSVMVAAAAIVIEYAIGGTTAVSIKTLSIAMFSTHTLIGVGEAVITVAVVKAVLTARPDLVAGAPVPVSQAREPQPV